MDIISVALKRHSTKAFDASKKTNPGTGRADQKLSCNTAHPAPTPQPWHFIVASTEEGKSACCQIRCR